MARPKRKFKPGSQEEDAAKRRKTQNQKSNSQEGRKTTKLHQSTKNDRGLPESLPSPAQRAQTLDQSLVEPSQGIRGESGAQRGDLQPSLTLETLSSAQGALRPSLESQYTLHSLNIGSSNSINKRVTQVITALSATDTDVKAPPLVEINSKAGTASKAISIVEIAKRELGKQGQFWYQYSVVSGFKTQVDTLHATKRKPARSKGLSLETSGSTGPRGPTSVETSTVTDPKNILDNAEEDDFETMETVDSLERERDHDIGGEAGSPKFKVVPALSIYLSRTRIEELQSKFGEQTNAKG
ncbi:MAG: cytoplasmic RNA-binding protein [Chaenotheca gracillima]|nr:MAG: cytoplasmic RNA-binding protein [Chaenotheca gracillima]